MHYFYLALAILGEVIGTSFLKATEDFTKLWPSLIVLLGYGAAFYFLTLSLKVIPVGIAYATWSGIGIVLEQYRERRVHCFGNYDSMGNS